MDKPEHLLIKYRNNECTPEEVGILLKYFTLEERLLSLETEIEHALMLNNEQDTAVNYEFSNEIAEVQERISEIIAKENGQAKVLRLWKRIAAVASIVMVIGIGLYWQASSFKQPKAIIDNQQANQVSPGKNAATLILANGKKMVLSDRAAGKLAEETGVTISKTNDGQIVYKMSDALMNGKPGNVGVNTLSTARGEEYQIILQDGTKVWLNAASSLKYPASFKGMKDRMVELHGEAYFEVAHNQDKAFKVKASGQIVEVLGTHFNISSYSEEPEIKTTLLSGSVKVHYAASQLEKKLAPGEQSVLDKRGGMKVLTADLEEAVAWKNGSFMFNDQSLQSIMRQIGRWYNVEIEYRGNQTQSMVFGGSLSRSSNLDEILQTLELTRSVHFKVEGRRIIVMN